MATPSMNNIMVTGGCGFIGVNFIRYLLKETDFAGRIVNVDKLTYAANPASLADIQEEFPKRYLLSRTDICDRDALRQVFEENGIDTICHFAAESHVDRSIYWPDAFVQTNIMGTYNLLELARSHQDQLALFHHVSTDEVFGSLGAEGFFTETTPYKPNSPYSASKASSDHLVRAYHKTYGLPMTLSNCSNNYGPFQFPEKLIPLMILNALEGKPLPVYGDGRHVRDWLYVRDHCAAIWRIMQAGERGRTYNVGGRNEMENIAVVQVIADLVDQRAPSLSGVASRRSLVTYVKDRPGHDRRYAIDCSRIEKELGWCPEETFETGIARTVDWYLGNPEWIEMLRSGDYKTWVEKHYA